MVRPDTISFDPATECEESGADSLVELLRGILQKSHLIEALNPDLILLQEVAKKDVVASDHPFAAWSGSNPHKVTEAADPSLPWHIPFSMDGLNIIALWAHQHTKDLRYVRVTHEIIDRHADFLSEGLIQSSKFPWLPLSSGSSPAPAADVDHEDRC